jgi:nonribosomal peptide synthetase CepB
VADRGAGPVTGDEAVLAGLWQRHAGTPPAPDRDFFDAGGTSLDLIRFVEEIGAGLGVELEFADVYGLRCFAELLGLVRARAEQTAPRQKAGTR